LNIDDYCPWLDRLLTFLLAALFCLALVSEDDRNEAALKKFGDIRTYRLSHKDRKGTMTLKTRVETVLDKKVAVFEDVFTGTIFEKKHRSSTVETASLDRFRMMSCKAHEKVGDEDIEIFIEVKGSSAAMSFTREGKSAAISCEFSEATVSEAALIRIFCAQVQKKGRRFKVDLFRDNIQVQKDHEFTCLGKETIVVDRKKFDAFKWQEEWTTKPHPKDSFQEDLHWERTYWVSGDGYLLRRVGIDGVLELMVEWI
jgi:hypothetical protein